MSKQTTHENILEKWEHLSDREKIVYQDDYETALMLNTLNRTDVEELKEKYKDVVYTPDLAGSGQFGICVKCGLPPTPEGHDGCLGTLPEDFVMNCCCGHGDDSQSYIQYWDGSCVRGEGALKVIDELKSN